MKIRYRSIFSIDWTEADLGKMKDLLTDPKQTYEIRLPCDHKKNTVFEGVRQCESCGDTLEITSYRER
jgi:hypothetical protein